MKDEVKLHIYSANPSTKLELPYVDSAIKAGFPSPAQDYLREHRFKQDSDTAFGNDLLC